MQAAERVAVWKDTNNDIPSVSEYAKDAIIFLDTIENDGKGHHASGSSLTKWVDAINGTIYKPSNSSFDVRERFTLINNTWSIFSKKSASQEIYDLWISTLTSGKFTLEFVIWPTATSFLINSSFTSEQTALHRAIGWEAGSVQRSFLGGQQTSVYPAWNGQRLNSELFSFSQRQDGQNGSIWITPSYKKDYDNLVTVDTLGLEMPGHLTKSSRVSRITLYDRVLSDDEVLHNMNLDAERFELIDRAKPAFQSE